MGTADAIDGELGLGASRNEPFAVREDQAPRAAVISTMLTTSNGNT